MNPPADPPQPASIDVFAWTAHPARERPLVALAVVGVIVALALLVGDTMGAGAWGVAAAVLMCMALGRFFFPTHYELSAREVVARGLMRTRRLEWGEVRRIEIGPRSAFVSTLPHRSARDARYGMLLLYGRSANDVRSRLEAAQRACAPSAAQE